MVFSSLIFIFLFLPATLVLYYLPFGRRYKNLCLFLCSLFFYAWGEPVYVLLMVLSISVNYVFGINIEKHRGKSLPILVAAVVFNMALIGFFKYSDFFLSTLNRILGVNIPLPDVALPIGISFYTFQIMTYVIDVYRGDTPAQRNYIKLGTYIAMFPQLIAGPIVRYSDIAKQLSHRRESIKDTAVGIRIFIIGLGKKAIIANSCGLIADRVFGDIGGALPYVGWIGIIAYAFQIYFDFSGYSTMAIGLGKMLGFDFPKNFDHPYISRSVTEFWRRWHITLGGFFRDYLYIPLGGNRVSTLRWLFNIFIVWFATGLWHGASFNFIFWGLYYGVLLAVEKLVLLKLWNRLPKFFGFAFTAAATLFGWVIFRSDNLTQIGEFFRLLFGGTGGSGTAFSYGITGYLPYILIGAVFATPFPSKLMDRFRKHAPFQVVYDVALAALFIISVAALTGETFNPFIYFRF